MLLVPGLALTRGLPLGLAATRAASDADATEELAEADAETEPCDPEGDDCDAAGEAVAFGEDAEADTCCDGEGERVGDGDNAVLFVGRLVGLRVAAEEVGGSVGEAEEPEGDGDGDGDFGGLGVGVGVGEGLGEGLAEEGIAWHFALEVPALRVAATSRSAPAFSAFARAVPERLASVPAISTAPASMLSATTRTGAKRMRIALSTLTITVTRCSSWGSETTG